jgi:hypothetical protein
MSTTCGFDEAWIGKCKEVVEREGDRCVKHQAACCSCGAPSTHSCEETGMFVCGAPLCDNCEHTIFPEGHNGGIGFNQLPCPEGMERHMRKSEQRYKPWYQQESTP